MEVDRRAAAGFEPFHACAAEAAGLREIAAERPLGDDAQLLVPLSVPGWARYPLGRRYCGHWGRPHRRNRVYAVVDVPGRRLWQCCWDPDCRRYRSPIFGIPRNALGADGGSK